MALTTKITVSIGRTIGLPNYGSLRVDESEEVTLQAGDDLATVSRETHGRVYNRLLTTLDAVIPK